MNSRTWEKRLTVFLTGLIIGLTIILLFACEQTNSPIPSPGDQATFTAGPNVVKNVADANFIQAATGVEGTGVTTYSSSNESVATVNASTGEVDILEVGSTTITAENAGDDSHNHASDGYLLVVLEPSFITTWETHIDKKVTIPIYNIGYVYDYTVDWGDGSLNFGVTTGITHTYASNGTYTIKIWGTFPGINFNNGGERDKILTIENWGTIEWRSMHAAFYGCSNLQVNASDSPDLSDVTYMSEMFYGAANFNSNISNWDVSSVTDMRGMFSGAANFNSDISNWDVSSVTDMRGMFYEADAFNSDISDWDVSHVTDMSSMFSSAHAFNSNISNWDVSSVTDMSDMFSSAQAFNSDISNWNVENVISMSGMFAITTAFNSDISNWDVSNVIYMTEMFIYATGFTNHDLSSWNVGKVEYHSDFSTGWGTGNIAPGGW